MIGTPVFFLITSSFLETTLERWKVERKPLSNQASRLNSFVNTFRRHPTVDLHLTGVNSITEDFSPTSSSRNFNFHSEENSVHRLKVVGIGDKIDSRSSSFEPSMDDVKGEQTLVDDSNFKESENDGSWDTRIGGKGVESQEVVGKAS